MANGSTIENNGKLWVDTANNSTNFDNTPPGILRLKSGATLTNKDDLSSGGKIIIENIYDQISIFTTANYVFIMVDISIFKRL